MRRDLGLAVARLAIAATLAACGGSAARGTEARSVATAPAPSFSEPGLRGPDDPTVHGARLLPANLGEARTWGVESGGGVRDVVAGVRFVSSPTGVVVAAADRLPANPSTVVEVPERLGGGFLMGLGPHLWRAPTWLGLATPVFTLSAPIAEVLVGLDRVYVRAAQGPLVAIDSRTGAGLDLGPLPASPRIVSIAALDAWRAVAVADLRGALMTLDAGASWRPIPLPIEPARAVALADAFAIAGFDGARVTQWWDVLPDGPSEWLASAPPSGSVADRDRIGAGAVALAASRTAPALQAAIEDGWPLTDGTALLAADGALSRVRLADGAVVERVPDAFSPRATRCHAFSLARPTDRGAFGFVCGEPHGTTVIFRWDATASRLVELRRFQSPREVLASGNGGLAVRGPCAAEAVERATEGRSEERTFCVMTPEVGEAPGSPRVSRAVVATDVVGVPSGRGPNDWSELHFSGPGADTGRLVVLSDGRAAFLRPPETGDLSTARLTLTAGVTAGAAVTHIPLRVQPAPPEVVRALRLGVWMDGFEERTPGVLSGWVDAFGSLLGVEVTLDGEVRAGESIRDAGAPVASGRWAFGWTAARGGFETTDGGMSWTKEIALPEPIAEPRTGRERSCGPMGCVLAGWLRVGWGDGPPAPPEPPPARSRGTRRPAGLAMDCDTIDHLASPLPSMGGGPVTEFRPFAGRAVAVPTGDVGLSADASHLLDRALRPRPLGRIYAWGPRAGDWDSAGRWKVLWSWPWSGSLPLGPDGRSSAVSAAPWPTLEAAAVGLGRSPGLSPDWTIVPGDDADHALLVERRTSFGVPAGMGGVLSLVTLETDQSPVEVRRAGEGGNGGHGGQPWGDLQSAVRTGDRWVLATSQGVGEPTATVVWVVDGGTAIEIGRVPRVSPELSGPVRLARRVGGPEPTGSSLGLVVIGPDPDRDRASSLWVSGFDPETRVFGDPELLAPADLSDRPIGPCASDDAGWEVEGTVPGSIDVRVDRAWSARLQGAMALLRLSRTAACVDSVVGSADPQSAASAAIDRTAGSAHGAPPVSRGTGSTTATTSVASASVVNVSNVNVVRTIGASVFTDSDRAQLRCKVRSP